MLTREDGAKGLNFLTPQIFDVAKRRMAEKVGTVDEYRLLHNMLSSQPMCFNLFGPMVDDLDLATRVFRKIVPGSVVRVTKVAIENAPERASEYLNDRTAFDAFAEFNRPDGTKGFLGIETKLTEPFSQKHYDDPKKQAGGRRLEAGGKTSSSRRVGTPEKARRRAPEYRRWSNRPDSPWPEEAWPHLADIGHNQLWRDHLLAVAMVMHPDQDYSWGGLMVVGHPEDVACTRAMETYTGLLKADDDALVDCPLDELVGVVEGAVQGKEQRAWGGEFGRRYLELGLSEEHGSRSGGA